MILHCVFLRFKAAIQEAEKQALYDGIAALKEFIPGMVDVKYGAMSRLRGWIAVSSMASS